MKKLPHALSLVVPACGAYAFFRLLLANSYNIGILINPISTLIFVGLLCAILLLPIFVAGGRYSKKEAVIIALAIALSLIAFSRFFYFNMYSNTITIELDWWFFFGFLTSPRWWMWTACQCLLAYFILRRGFSAMIKKDDFFDN